MKIYKCLLIVPALMMVGCQKELDKNEVNRRIRNIQYNYMPLLNTSYDIKVTNVIKDANGKVNSKTEWRYTNEKYFGTYVYRKITSEEGNNVVEAYAVIDANGDKIKHYKYEVGDDKDQVTYIGKTLSESDYDYLPTAINTIAKGISSQAENSVYSYQNVDNVFGLYKDYCKYYAIGDEDIKIVASYKDKDTPKSGEYEAKVDITAVYKDRTIASYRETTRSTSGASKTVTFDISFKEPDIKLPKNYKDYIREVDNGTQR